MSPWQLAAAFGPWLLPVAVYVANVLYDRRFYRKLSEEIRCGRT